MFRNVFLCVTLFFVALTAAASPDTATINALLEKSVKLQLTNQSECYRLAHEALALSKDIGYKKGIGTAYIRIGSILYTNGKNDSALHFIKEAYNIRTLLGDDRGAAGACILLSYIYQSLGKKDSAFSSLYDALRLNTEEKDSVNMVQIYISLGNLGAEYDDDSAALENYLKATELSQKMRYAEGIVLSWDGLGRHYISANQFKKALPYFQSIDSACTKSGDAFTAAQNLTNIGLCYENLKDYKLARQYYRKALDEYIRLNMINDMALGYYNLGSTFLNLDQPDSTIVYLNSALSLARQSDDLLRVARCYQVLAKAYSQKGDFPKAYNYHLQYSAISDSILNTEKVKQIAEMKTKYETELKEQQINLLDAQNKTKAAQRNLFIAAALLFLLLAIAIFIGWINTSKEKKKSDKLLLNILPAEVADELKRRGKTDAKQFENVTVMFTDFKDFTRISEHLTPAELVAEIDIYFSAFDKIITKYNIEKIKTIGDGYMCAGGLPVANHSHPEDVVNAALEIQQFSTQHAAERNAHGLKAFETRIGIHTGPVVAGIVGTKKFAYDIWGDTVNVASRMESSSQPGKVSISATTYELVKNKFKCMHRGSIAMKNKGSIDMYFVEETI